MLYPGPGPTPQLPSFTPPPGPGGGPFPAPASCVSALASAHCPDLSHSPGPGPGHPGEEEGVTVSLCSSSSLMAEGLLATEFLCGKQVASLIPFSVPRMGWSRPLALTKRPSCCEGGRFPEDTWVWRFPSGKNLYGVEPPHALSLALMPFQGTETEQPGCVGTRRAVRTELSAHPEQGSAFLTGCFPGCVQLSRLCQRLPCVR